MEEVPAMRWMYAAIRDAVPVALQPGTHAAPEAGEAAFPHEAARGLKLTPPPGTAAGWPSLPCHQVLMVRHIFDRFIERHVWCVLPEVVGAVGSRRPDNLLVITGTPGIGKSAFGMYLLHRALNAGKTAVLVQQDPLEPTPTVTVFHDETVWRASSTDSVFAMTSDPNVVHVYDGVRPDTLSVNTILIAPPDRSLWRKVMKVHGTRLLQLPAFSLHELLQLQQLEPSISPEEVSERYALVGGNARLVMNGASQEDNRRLLGTKASEFKPSHLDTMSCRSADMWTDEALHYLAHYVVDRDTFGVTGMAFVSEEARHLCMARLNVRVESTETTEEMTP
ncbi:MAG: hypothetical protein EOO65_04440 [Methanosarcinales archaeon]|nr:MAG: hypothetical protein EOO65_04440 [Methanosarcinales archaeon]